MTSSVVLSNGYLVKGAFLLALNPTYKNMAHHHQVLSSIVGTYKTSTNISRPDGESTVIVPSKNPFSVT